LELSKNVLSLYQNNKGMTGIDWYY